MILPGGAAPIGQGFSTAHQAVDQGSAAWFDKPIYAPHSGTVTAVGQMGSGTNNAGLAVDITGGRYKSRMGHLDSYSVKVGQVVKEGQEIGRMGYTGYTIPAGKNGTHTHWILWDNGTRVDGRKYITSSPPSGGTGGSIVKFQNIEQVKLAYLLIRGKLGTTAEMQAWVGQDVERFFKLAKKETDATRAALVAANKQVTSLVSQVETLKKQVAAGGTGGQFVPAGVLYVKKG
jgi:murein DD-endopeptidase MepM/ murein hydrolase activator NlpD